MRVKISGAHVILFLRRIFSGFKALIPHVLFHRFRCSHGVAISGGGCINPARHYSCIAGWVNWLEWINRAEGKRNYRFANGQAYPASLGAREVLTARLDNRMCSNAGAVRRTRMLPFHVGWCTRSSLAWGWGKPRDWCHRSAVEGQSQTSVHCADGGLIWRFRERTRSQAGLYLLVDSTWFTPLGKASGNAKSTSLSASARGSNCTWVLMPRHDRSAPSAWPSNKVSAASVLPVKSRSKAHTHRCTQCTAKRSRYS